MQNKQKAFSLIEALISLSLLSLLLLGFVKAQIFALQQQFDSEQFTQAFFILQSSAEAMAQNPKAANIILVQNQQWAKQELPSADLTQSGLHLKLQWYAQNYMLHQITI